MVLFIVEWWEIRKNICIFTILKKTVEDKHHITHQLHKHYEVIKSYKRKKAFLASPFYASHQQAINEVIDGLEWDNTISIAPAQKETLRVLSWNIERGKQLDEIINFLKSDSELSQTDVILAIECDNGMGRTANRNVTKELAEAIGMNYCFVPSYLVLGKGAEGETSHKEANTTALHGTSILSKHPILEAKGVKVPPVKEVFHSKEKRLGTKKGLVAKIQVGEQTVSLGAIHVDLTSTMQDRANQLAALIDALPKADIQLIGGDFNCSTFELRKKGKLLIQCINKYFTLGYKGAIPHYMTPELKFDKPMFDQLLKNGFDFETFNDRKKGTIYFDINDLLHNEKAKKFMPGFLLNSLERNLRPWKGVVPLKIDWFAGKGTTPINPQTIERPTNNNVLLSDHNPIYVDLKLSKPL
jgi:endonuclease/exonuclease/phosphatase family metal-dependent hydrolase